MVVVIALVADMVQENEKLQLACLGWIESSCLYCNKARLLVMRMHEEMDEPGPAPAPHGCQVAGNPCVGVVPRHSTLLPGSRILIARVKPYRGVFGSGHWTKRALLAA